MYDSVPLTKPGRGVLGDPIARARHPEVGELDVAVEREQDVLRRHVAMDHRRQSAVGLPALVGGGEPAQHAQCRPSRPAPTAAAAPSLRMRLSACAGRCLDPLRSPGSTIGPARVASTTKSSTWIRFACASCAPMRASSRNIDEHTGCTAENARFITLIATGRANTRCDRVTPCHTRRRCHPRRPARRAGSGPRSSSRAASVDAIRSRARRGGESDRSPSASAAAIPRRRVARRARPAPCRTRRARRRRELERAERGGRGDQRARDRPHVQHHRRRAPPARPQLAHVDRRDADDRGRREDRDQRALAGGAPRAHDRCGEQRRSTHRRPTRRCDREHDRERPRANGGARDSRRPARPAAPTVPDRRGARASPRTPPSSCRARSALEMRAAGSRAIACWITASTPAGSTARVARPRRLLVEQQREPADAAGSLPYGGAPVSSGRAPRRSRRRRQRARVGGAPRLLGRHVRGRADHRAGAGEPFVVVELGDAEVEHLRRVALALVARTGTRSTA